MKLRLSSLLFLLLAVLAGALPSPARASLSDCMSEEEFRALANELAPKVNLFAEAWRQDPAAEFYGGTTRDFLYWVKGKFQTCSSREDGKQVADQLRREKTIDVREFIIGDSDVDVVTKSSVDIDPAKYGIKKIDAIAPEIFDPASERGMNEAVQGYIPAEKVRLRSAGLHPPGAFGDGLGEIYSGKLTVHFTAPEEFAKGHYAKQGLNHPILLALRYQRLLGINYFKTFGAGRPDPRKLFAIDPDSERAVRAVVESAAHGDELAPYFEKPQFTKWFNAAIQKSFRSYTNPTAAKEILEHFGVPKLAKLYSRVEPINQYVFQRYRDEEKVVARLRALGVDPTKLYTPVSARFPDGHLYHGTKDEASFRGILLQGFLPSESGSGGAGLYGVPETNRKFAEDWGRSKDRLIRIPLKPDAKLVDVTTGEGKRAWEAFPGGKDKYEEFADAVGADLLRYPYNTEAYVVKNGAVLGKPEGVNRRILTLGEARTLGRAARDFADVEDLAKSLAVNQFSAEETAEVVAELPHALIANLRSAELPPSEAEPLLFLFTRENYAGGFPRALRERIGPRAGWVPALLSEIDSLARWQQVAGTWPEGWEGADPAEFRRTLARLKPQIPDGTFGPYKDFAAMDLGLNGPPEDDLARSRRIKAGVALKNNFGRGDTPLAAAWREEMRPEALTYLRSVTSSGTINGILPNSTGSALRALLSAEEDQRSIIEAWRKSGALRTVTSPILDWKDLEWVTRRLPIAHDTLAAKFYGELRAPLLQYLEKLQTPDDIRTLFSSYLPVVKELLSAEDQRAVSENWDRRGLLKKYAADWDDLYKFMGQWHTVAVGDSPLSQALHEKLEPHFQARAREWAGGRSVLARAYLEGKMVLPAYILDTYAKGEISPVDRNQINILAKQARTDIESFELAWVKEAFQRSPTLAADRELAQALVARPPKRFPLSDWPIFWLLQNEKSEVRRIAETKDGIRKILEHLREDPRLVPDAERTKLLRTVLDWHRTHATEMYSLQLGTFFDSMERNLSNYHDGGVGNAQEGDLVMALLPLERTDPMLHTFRLGGWIDALTKCMSSCQFVKKETYERFAEFLRLPEVAQLPEAPRAVEAMIGSKFIEEARLQPIVDLLKDEPWSRHPRVSLWRKALEIHPRKTREGVQLTARQELLQTWSPARLLHSAQENSWRKSILPPETKPATTGLASCLGFFRRLAGGGS